MRKTYILVREVNPQDFVNSMNRESHNAERAGLFVYQTHILPADSVWDFVAILECVPLDTVLR